LKNSILGKFLSSGVQALAVQILGIFFFYFISFYCSKENFGMISWANAVSMFLTTVLSFGMEQVVIRRIAVSKTSDWAAAAFLFHSFVGSLVVLILLFVSCLFKGQESAYHYLPYFFIAQSLLYIASPLRQYLNAKERFAPYAIIAVFSNIGKIVAAFWVVKTSNLTLWAIISIMIGFSIFEFTSLFIYITLRKSFQFKLQFRFVAYKKLIREALPQYLAVIFDSSLSRMDWILLGMISTSIATADYSFAYRAFEISKLPLVIVAPVIMPRFAKLMNKNVGLDEQKESLIQDIFIVEMFLSVGLILVMNTLWTPLVGGLTKGKYGAGNMWQFLLLSLCLPLQFFTNLLWTISFTGKKYKTVSFVTIISAVCNLMLNLVLIPILSGTGAAIAFLVTCVLQSGIYYIFVKREFVSFPVMKLLLLYLFAAGSYYLSGIAVTNLTLKIIISVLIYSALCVLFKQVGKKQYGSLKEILAK